MQHGAVSFVGTDIQTQSVCLGTASTVKVRAVGSARKADSIALYADDAFSSQTLAVCVCVTAALAPFIPQKHVRQNSLETLVC